jgi:acyl carrier protein
MNDARVATSQDSKLMNHIDRVRGAVHRAVDAVNDFLPSGQLLEADDNIVLLGSNADLDSMGFVNFIVAVEEELEREFGRDLSIGDFLNMRTGDGAAVSTIGDVIKVLSQRLA